MRSIFILSFLLMVSCGKTKDVGGPQVSPVVEQRSFLAITHEEGASPFRNKLLNEVVEETFPSAEKKVEVKNYDELENYPMDERDLKIYKEKEQGFAKVIISFPNRFEVYFLPQGIPLTNVVSHLGLSSDQDRKFKFLKNDFIKTSIGSTFYLVNLNHDDLIKNDKKFFQKEIDFKNKFVSLPTKLEVKKTYELTVNYFFAIQSLRTDSFSYAGNCRTSGRGRGGWEDGGSYDCGTCHYQRNVAGPLEKAINVPLVNLGFALKINGKVENAADLKAEASSESFKITLNPENQSEMEIVQLPSVVTSVQSGGFNYSGSGVCPQRPSGVEVLGSRAEFSVVLKISGRGEELNQIIL